MKKPGTDFKKRRLDLDVPDGPTSYLASPLIDDSSFPFSKSQPRLQKTAEEIHQSKERHNASLVGCVLLSVLFAVANQIAYKKLLTKFSAIDGRLDNNGFVRLIFQFVGSSYNLEFFVSQWSTVLYLAQVRLRQIILLNP